MQKRPSAVIAAAALEAAEGLAAVAFGAYVGVETAVGAAVDPMSGIGVTLLALAGGIGMLACARGILRAEPWSRAPTVLTQLFALPVAWSLWQSDQPFYAVPLGVVAVLALITVLSPPSTAWLVQDRELDDEDDEDATADVNDTGTATGGAKGAGREVKVGEPVQGGKGAQAAKGGKGAGNAKGGKGAGGGKGSPAAKSPKSPKSANGPKGGKSA
ncbi:MULTISPECIES: hypothetical protein [Actinomadura]|uniref:Integral membrane protein n=1 Tax=Actinomadura yumaensis TaxID=111807 RepID=A0ABW2CBS4_9ACTN|nr:hypothetical protein [Actinomadura sp. J1-007]